MLPFPPRTIVPARPVDKKLYSAGQQSYTIVALFLIGNGECPIHGMICFGPTSLVPRCSVSGEKSSWYALFVHEARLPRFLGFGGYISPCYTTVDY